MLLDNEEPPLAFGNIGMDDGGVPDDLGNAPEIEIILI